MCSCSSSRWSLPSMASTQPCSQSSHAHRRDIPNEWPCLPKSHFHRSPGHLTAKPFTLNVSDSIPRILMRSLSFMSFYEGFDWVAEVVPWRVMMAHSLNWDLWFFMLPFKSWPCGTSNRWQNHKFIWGEGPAAARRMEPPGRPNQAAFTRGKMQLSVGALIVFTTQLI